MRERRRSITVFVPALGAGCAALALASRASGLDPGEFLFVDRSLTVEPARVVEFSDESIAWLDTEGTLEATPIGHALALLPETGSDASAPLDETGLLLLADGQCLPGTMALSVATDDERVAWSHPWLGRLDVALDSISAVTFRPGAAVPQSGQSDVLILTNGDRLEGIVAQIGDPLVMKIEREGRWSELRLPLERAAALALVTPPARSSSPRVWFRDGTILDVSELAVGDDRYLRLRAALPDPTSAPDWLRLDDVRAVIFQPALLVPLGALEHGAPSLDALHATSAPRFLVPGPRSTDPDAPFGLGPIEYRGPVVVRYALPAGAARFAAQAILAPTARDWGDLVLVIRDDDTEVWRRRLDRAHATETINVPLTGSELTIELEQGAHGPIQDHLLLERAMILVQ